MWLGSYCRLGGKQVNNLREEDDEPHNGGSDGCQQHSGGPQVFDVTFAVVAFGFDEVGSALKG